MNGQMEDCIYDDLPDMCDTSSSFNDENPSPSLNQENASNLPVENCIRSSTSSKNKTNISAKKCTCHKSLQWAWDSDCTNDFVEIVNNNMDVRFHKKYSNGTAVVRCTEPMSNNQYYWEVKMTYPVYGTDIMIGVGTSEATLKNHLQDRFVSFLGMDNKTWGFSYTGLFHHNGQRRCYAPSFGQGNVIGVHLDLWKGTLSFYKDKKHLGIASSGLKGKTLYAMASSTAARSGMRIIRSCSFPSSLQFLCCSRLRELIPDDKNVLDVLDIPPGLKNFLQNRLGWLLEKRHFEKEDCCMDNENHEQDSESIADESYVGTVFNDVGAPESYISSQFILLGSVLLSNHNRFQRAIRNVHSEDREDLPESEAKRQRRSFSYSYSLSDDDSD